MKYITFLTIVFLVFSCGSKTKKDKADTKPKPLMSVAQKHQKTVGVKPHFLKSVTNWSSLKAVDSFFVKYRNISPNEALNNALELKDLVKKLKDTIKPEIFDVPSFGARVNILYNESLRLVDLKEIPAIKANEVNDQVAKTIAAFSAVNIKINTVLLKNKLEDEVKVEINHVGLDSTKIDAISKETINARLLEKRASNKKKQVLKTTKE